MNERASTAAALSRPSASPWPRVAIGDVARTSSGTTPSRRRAERYFAGGTVPWVKTLDLRNGEISATDECVTDLAVQETSLQVYPPGTVLVAMYGGFNQIGRTGLLRIPACVNQALSAIQVNRNRVVPEYLLAVLNFRVEYWKAVASSSRKDPNITGNDVRAFELPVPPIEEQRSIAAALSDVDALLAKLDQLIAKKHDLKQAAMQQLLTSRTRLPGFADVWRDVTIGDVADVKTGPFGSSLHESDYVDNGTPIITVEHLGERSITRQNLPMVSDEDCRRLRAYSLQPGDVVFSRVGSIDRNALVTESESGWLFSGRLLRVRVRRDGADPAFLSHQFHSEPFKQRVREVAVGQTMPSLNTQILRRLPVALPTLVEQRAIAQVLSEMDTELTALEARLEKTRQLKQGMMQALLTGRIRLGPAPAGEAQSGC